MDTLVIIFLNSRTHRVHTQIKAYTEKRKADKQNKNRIK